MKSGPHLNGCTVKPRLLSAAIKPSVIVVLPTPLEGPAITNAFGVMTDSSCAPWTVRRGVPWGHRIRVCEDVDENDDDWSPWWDQLSRRSRMRLDGRVTLFQYQR